MVSIIRLPFRTALWTPQSINMKKLPPSDLGMQMRWAVSNPLAVVPHSEPWFYGGAGTPCIESGARYAEAEPLFKCLTLSLERAFHQIVVCVRHLETQFLEPRGSRQYHICKTPGRLVHEQINADDHFCLVEAVGDPSCRRFDRQQFSCLSPAAKIPIWFPHRI
jgi:hypothetical protein